MSLVSIPQLLIIPGLYLGPIESAFKDDELKAAGISHIIDLSNTKYHRREFLKYLSIAIEDASDAPIHSHFERCAAFIDDGRKSGGVLVHCQAGVSRSPTIVIAYLMYHKRIPFEEALRAVEKRRKIDPNNGFRQQLKAYEAHLGISTA